MPIVEETLIEIQRSLSDARRLASQPAFEDAFTRYGNAIAQLVGFASLVDTKLVPVHNVKQGVEAAIAEAYGESTVYFEGPNPVLPFAFKVIEEAVDFAMASHRELEAYSLIEMLRTRRLYVELATLQAEQLGAELHYVALEDFGPPGLRYITSLERYATGMLCFYVSSAKHLYAFLIRPEKDAFSCSRVLVLESARFENLSTTVHSYLDALRHGAFGSAQNHLDDILKALADPLRPLLAELELSSIRKLIICPFGILHQLPLHAIPFDTGSQSRLLDLLDIVVYAPSLSMYAAIASDKDASTWGWTACGYFDFDNLACGAAGLTFFATFFQSLKLRLLTRSVKPDLLDTTVIHFDCHGAALRGDFMDSRLFLADGHLSFRDILQTATLTKTWLVFLNACETGLSAADMSSSEEYYGLDGAFLARGALNVVSTLAPVLDSAACLLEARFYLNIVIRRMDVAVALRDAQLWLRDGAWKSDDELKTLIEMLPGAAERHESPYFAERMRVAHRRLTSLLDGGADHRFFHPIFWAQWKCSGYGHNFPMPTKTTVDPLY